MGRQSSQVEEYRRIICHQLSRIYPAEQIIPEWVSMRDETGLYSPRLDIAVGPFATTRRFIEEYDDLMDHSRGFINTLIRLHVRNVRDYDNSSYSVSFKELKEKNYNSRCLLAIEIENQVSRKHIIGGAVNASALGRIGILVAWTPEKLKAAIKLRRYLGFLASVGKNTFDTTNLVILNKDQFLQATQSC